MQLVIFLVAFAAFGFIAAHFLEVRGSQRAAGAFLTAARAALVLMIVIVLASTCVGGPPAE